MTSPTVGDRGHRFEIRADGYPTAADDNVIGWHGEFNGACRMAKGIVQAPGCTKARVLDRAFAASVVAWFAKDVFSVVDQPRRTK